MITRSGRELHLPRPPRSLPGRRRRRDSILISLDQAPLAEAEAEGGTAHNKKENLLYSVYDANIPVFLLDAGV